MNSSLLDWSLDIDIRPVIDGFVRKIERVPLLNIAGGIIQDYQYLWENYYFPSTHL
jgi:peroxin-16